MQFCIHYNIFGFGVGWPVDQDAPIGLETLIEKGNESVSTSKFLSLCLRGMTISFF